MTVSHCSSVVSESVAAHSTPAFRTARSRPPSRFTASATDASTASASRASAAQEGASRARRDALAAGPVAAGEDDSGALRDQQRDDRLSDPGRAAGDERAQIGMPCHCVQLNQAAYPLEGRELPRGGVRCVFGLPRGSPSMRRLLRIRRLVSAAALAALVAVPATAGAAQVDVGGLNGGFSGGTDGWTSTASCAPLCSVTNGFDPAGASDPGSASVVYTTLGGLLGGLATGTSTWTSPSFTWTNPEPGERLAHAPAQGRDRRSAHARRHRERSRPAARRHGRNDHDARQRGDLGGRYVVRQALARDRAVAARAGALLPRRADDEPRGRRPAERRPRLLRRRGDHRRRRRRRRRRHEQYRHEWRQRRGERLRLRPRHARRPGCRTADAARRTARGALHAGPVGDDPDPRDARGKARQARRRDPAHGRRDAARLDGAATATRP